MQVLDRNAIRLRVHGARRRRNAISAAPVPARRPLRRSAGPGLVASPVRVKRAAATVDRWLAAARGVDDG